jgi:hypothetical protein
VEGLVKGGTPGKKPTAAFVPSTVTAVEVDPPFHSTSHSFNTEAGCGDSHFTKPVLGYRVDTGRVLETRIPSRVVHGLLVKVYGQVNPLIGGSDFKLPVSVDMLGERVDEHFDDIAVPQPPTFQSGALALIDEEFRKLAPEAEIEVGI